MMARWQAFLTIRRPRRLASAALLAVALVIVLAGAAAVFRLRPGPGDVQGQAPGSPPPATGALPAPSADQEAGFVFELPPATPPSEVRPRATAPPSPPPRPPQSAPRATPRPPLSAAEPRSAPPQGSAPRMPDAPAAGHGPGAPARRAGPGITPGAPQAPPSPSAATPSGSAPPADPAPATPPSPPGPARPTPVTPEPPKPAAAPVLTPPVPIVLDPPRHPEGWRVVVERPGLAAEARPERLTARVRLRLSLREDGTVARAQIAVSSGRPDLDDAAAAAAQGWRFQPARRDGVPIASVVLIWVAFVVEP